MSTTESDLTSIQKTFSDYIAAKNAYFTQQNTEIQNIFEKITNTTTGEVNDLKLQVDSQNGQIEKQIFTNKKDSNETSYVKSEYQDIELNKIKYQNKMMYYIYYTFVLVLGVILFFFGNLPFPAKIGVFLVMMAYPFFIYYIEIFVYIFFKYIYSLISTSKFNNVYIDNY